MHNNMRVHIQLCILCCFLQISNDFFIENSTCFVKSRHFVIVNIAYLEINIFSYLSDYTFEISCFTD